MIPAVSLNTNSETPLYRQLYEQLRTLIQSGKLARGERLPATRELAGNLGLNRTTVSAAYELLEKEGLLRGHVGKGSFVNGQLAGERFLDWDQILGPSSAPGAVIEAAAISFAASRPDATLFPLSEFRACVDEVMSSPDFAAILQLGSPLGYEPLRAYLLENSPEVQAGDAVLITNGCQQAIDLIQRLLIRPGDSVAIEDPVYPGLRSSLLAAGARATGIPVGPEGVDIDAVSALRPKLLVVTPNFQNPTGATMPLSAREKLLAVARDIGAVVVENDLYGSLRYEGTPLPTLKMLDAGGDVILMRSFSKISFPGLRVGWVIGPEPVIRRLAEAKQSSDLHSDQLAQAVLHRFVKSGRLARHLKQVIASGTERLTAVVEACEEHMPEGTRFTRPNGGMNLWVRLPSLLDAGELLPRATREGVNYLPGRFFAVSRPEPSSLRLSFAGLPPEQIREGVGILGQVFRSELDRVRAARNANPAPALV